MTDLSKEIIREIGLAGPYGLSLHELFSSLNYLEKDAPMQRFLFMNLKRLKLGIIYTGSGQKEDDIDKLSLDELLSNNNYRFIVSDTQREWAVMGSFFKSYDFSDSTFLVFSLIAKSKSYGISQVELGKAANMDGKTIFYHLKVLGKAKVIVKYPIIHSKVKTHLCIHADFADQNPGYQQHVQLRTSNVMFEDDFCFVDSGINHADLVKVKISTLLEKAKNQILATDDLFDVIEEGSDDSFERRIFNRILQKMQNSGNIEIVYVMVDDDKTLRAAKLITPFRLSKSRQFTGFEKNSASSIKYALKRSNDMLLDQSAVCQGGFICDLSIEWQIFRLIYLSGSQGLTSNMIFKSLRMEGIKLLEKALERLLKGDGSKGLSITKVFENIGREKRYRYFACKKAVDHFKGDNKHAQDDSDTKGKRGAKQSAIHLSSLQRRNNILELLEIHKVLECGSPLINAYENLMEERGTQTGYRIDRKTLDRTAKSLQDDKLLSMHVIRIPQMAGSVLSKTLLLHKSLTMKDRVVQDFIESMQTKLFQANTGQKRYMDNIEVERFKPRKKKIKVIEKPSEEGPLLSDVPVFRGDHDPSLIEFPFPAQEYEEEVENQSSNSWIACLRRNGFIQNVIPRARILHAWLFQKVTNGMGQYVDNGWFSLSMLLNDLDFSMFMKLVGLTAETPALREFLDNKRFTEYTTGNLPQDVRDAVFSRGYVRYRREIKSVLSELERLKVISPGDNQIQGDDNLWTKYQLNEKILLPQSGKDLSNSCHITDLETLGNFWVKVNYFQSKADMAGRQRKSRAKTAKPDAASAAEKVQPKEPSPAVISTPNENLTYEKSPSVAEIMKLERRVPSPLKSVKSRLSMKKDSKKSENILTMKSVAQNDHIKARQRVQWSSSELLRLLVYYTILSHESRPKKILIWKSILAKFPQYGENRCKKQIEAAKKDKFLSTQLEWLKNIWQKTIQDHFKNSQVNFDLDNLAELLLSKIDVDSWYILHSLIARSSKGKSEEAESERKNNLCESSLCTLEERNIEKFIAEKQTTKAKMDYLLKFPFTCHMYNPQSDDYCEEKLTEHQIKIDVAKATIKSVLLTSESNYDPVVATGILESIEPDILDLAFSELNSSNVLSKVKGGKARQGPGRGYQLSDRFLTSLSAGFPVGFIANAKSFLEKLSKCNVEYSTSIGRGEMACIMNEIPRETIRFKPRISLLGEESLEEQEYSFPLEISYNLVSLKQNRETSDDEPENESKKRRTTSSKDSPNTEISESQRDILSIIKQGGIFGSTKYDLKKLLKSLKTLDQDLIALEKTSKISRVGYSGVRFVEKSQSINWEIRKHGESYPPHLWYDISGEIISLFFETALENAVSVIHDFPGIYFSKLRQMLPFTALELEILLNTLQLRGIIFKSVLSESEIPKVYSKDISSEISTYRLTSEWFKKM